MIKREYILNMGFKQNIKNLKQKYHQAMKQYYDDERIICKMICNRFKYNDFYEGELAFRTCVLNKFDDDKINQLREKSNAKAIEMLRLRGVCCLYASSIFKTMVEENSANTKLQQQALNELRDISQQLYIYGEGSLTVANGWARKNGAELFYNTKFVAPAVKNTSSHFKSL